MTAYLQNHTNESFGVFVFLLLFVFTDEDMIQKCERCLYKQVGIEPASRNKQVVGGKGQKRKKKEVVTAPSKKKKGMFFCFFYHKMWFLGA